jgi:hypothetical protein
MGFLKTLPLLVGIACVTALGLFGTGDLGWPGGGKHTLI